MNNFSKKLVALLAYVLLFIGLTAVTIVVYSDSRTNQDALTVAYVFTTFAIMLASATLILSYRSPDSYMLKISSVIVTHIYAGVSIVVGYFVAIFRFLFVKGSLEETVFLKQYKFVKYLLDIKILLSLYIILTTLVVIYLLVERVINKGIIKNEKKFTKARNTQNDLLLEVDKLIRRYENTGEDAKVLKALEDLEEAIKYSPTIGEKYTKNKEHKTDKLISKLKVDKLKVEDVEEIIMLVQDRNSELMLKQ